MYSSDSYRVGILPEYNFRFLLTECSRTIQEVALRHNLKNSSALLVAKAMVGAFFLAGLVKDETVVSLQMEGEGEVERVMAYSDRIGRMRGLAKHNNILAEEGDLTLGIGKGIFRVTRWGGVQQLQQSLTEMQEKSFEENLLNYIHDSDQLTSYLGIYTELKNGQVFGGGVIFQALPNTEKHQIQKLQEKLNNLGLYDSLVLSLNPDVLIELIEDRLQTKIQILESGIPEFYCGCSLDKIKKVVISLGKEEAFSILEERGKVELSCEFCRELYTLDAEEVQLLFM